ncbi:hypothetical protein ACSLNI_27270, partial [Escherichia coli]
AQENHNITSETGLRHYLLEWLSGASRHPEFRSLPCEKMAQASSDRKNVGNGRKGGTGCEDWKRGMPG